MSRINARPPGQGKKGSRVRQSLRRRYGDSCWWCGDLMDFDVPAGTTPRSVTRDHIIERSRGGRDTLANQRLAHFSCNNMRSAKKQRSKLKKRVVLHLKFWSLEILLLKKIKSR